MAFPERPKTPEGKKDSFTWEHFYSDDILQRHMIEQAKKALSDENLLFLRDYNDLKKTFQNLNDEGKIEKCTRLYNEYFLAGQAPREINISADMRARIPQLPTTAHAVSEFLFGRDMVVNDVTISDKVGDDIQSAIESLSKDNILGKFVVEKDFSEEWRKREKSLKELVSNCKTLKDFNALKTNPDYQAVKASYGVTGVPTIMGPGTQEVLNLGNKLEKEFEESIEKVKSDYQKITKALQEATFKTEGTKPKRSMLNLFANPEEDFNQSLIRWRNAFDSIKLKDLGVNFEDVREKVFDEVNKELEKAKKAKSAIQVKCENIIESLRSWSISAEEIDSMVDSRSGSRSKTPIVGGTTAGGTTPTRVGTPTPPAPPTPPSTPRPTPPTSPTHK